MDQLNFKQLLLKNSAVQLASQAVSMATGLIFNAIISRHLGAEGFGQFNYVFAFYYFFLSLNDFGTNTIIVREVSRDRTRADEIIGSMLSFKLLIASTCVLASWIIILLMNFPAELRNVLLLFSLILPLTALQVPFVIFQVLLKAEYPAVIGALARVFTLTLVIASTYFGLTLLRVVIVFLMGEIFWVAAMWLYSSKFVRLRSQLAFRLWKEILRSSVPLGFSLMFVAVINRIDFLMLERMTDLHQVGLYSAAYKITNLLEAFPLIIMTTVYPVMSRYSKTNRPALKVLYEKCILYLGSLGVLIGIMITFFSPWMTVWIFGNEFKESAAALRVLIWSTVFLYFSISGGNLLISLGKEKINLVLYASAAAFNVGLNFLLIPRYGFVGSALATTLTFFFLLVGITTASFKILYPSRKASLYMNSPA